MNSDYNLSNELLCEYKAKLTGLVFKILPMKEEGCPTWRVYIQSLLYELIGATKLFEELSKSANFISLISTLRNLLDEEDVKVVKREVFKCLDLIQKI